MFTRRRWLGIFALVVFIAPIATGQTPSSEQKKFVILFTNDDGYNAPGLQALVRAFAGYAVLYIAAPAQNQSGKGHSITTSGPMWVQERRTDGVIAGYAIEGPPATCARVGIDKLLPAKPDLVLSGINAGENLGLSVYLSGTLGAAREAAFSRIPAMAISQQLKGSNRIEDYAAGAALVRQLVEQLRAENKLQPGFFLNVNIPAGTPRGTKLASMNTTPDDQGLECSIPLERDRVCFSRWKPGNTAAAGTDVGEFYQGFITLTPMTLDVTDAKAEAALKSLEKLSAKAAN
jgi:5'-nucleotidase